MKTLNKIHIKDTDEFSRLFKINIPVAEEFDYYIQTLSKSEEFSGPIVNNKLLKLVEEFAEFEIWVKEQGYSSIHDYKMKSLDLVKNHILNSEAYKKFNTAELPSIPMERRDWLNKEDDELAVLDTLVSIDFRSANYNILRGFDESDEFPREWLDYATSLGIHKTLAKSKTFRQFVFGNTNPKRLQTYQHSKIMSVVNYLKKNYGIADEKIVFISHDEVIFRVRTANMANHILLKSDSIEKLVDMPVRFSFFALNKLKKNTFVKTVYSIDSFAHSSDYHFRELYKALHGVPGNKFYMYFKEYILKEELDERDLMYYSEDQLCKWVVGGKKSIKRPLPHYDKPGTVLSMRQAQSEYSFLWDKLGSSMPDMSNEEKRRVIELFLNTCSSCFQAEKGCQCWNDD
jgi:hypothetical protein